MGCPRFLSRALLRGLSSSRLLVRQEYSRPFLQCSDVDPCSRFQVGRGAYVRVLGVGLFSRANRGCCQGFGSLALISHRSLRYNVTHSYRVSFSVICLVYL